MSPIIKDQVRKMIKQKARVMYRVSDTKKLTRMSKEFNEKMAKYENPRETRRTIIIYKNGEVFKKTN